MKKWKLYQFCIFILLCLALNFGGRLLSRHFSLPLWLDSMGTALCAYMTGPVCGCIVGLTGNLIVGMQSHLSVIYGLTSMAMGLIVGRAARNGKMDTAFGTMSVASLVTLAAVAVSAPLNILFYHGSTGNIWGDGVIAYLQENGFPALVSQVIGQFYIDFADKTLTLMALFLLLRLARRIAGKRADRLNDGEEQSADGKPGALKALALLLALGLALSSLPGAARAEDEKERTDYTDYVQTVYASQNGLPCGEANDIAQTNDGILWVGTYAGLYRYNGREFRWMDGFASVHNVNCLYVDEEGRLWIGTNDNGLSIMINEKIVNVVDESRGLPSNSVRAITQGGDGLYYVGTTGSMQILSLNNGLKKVNTLWEINYADHLAADESGRVAAVTSDGRLFLLKGGQVLSSRQLSRGGEVFKSCQFDAKGRLLAGTTAGQIYVFDVSRGWFETADVWRCGNLTSIKELYFLESGELFITADNGVGYMDLSGAYYPVNTNDFNNSIDNMLIDYQGNLWFTSSRLGLLRMAPSAFRDVYASAGMSRRVVNAVAKWQGVYYFGTDKGMDAMDAACKQRVTNQWTEKLSGVRIRCMMVDGAGSLWVCTYGRGLLEITEQGEEYLYNSQNGSFGDRSRLVTQLRDGTVLAAGDTGISFIRDHEILCTIGHADGLINSMILTAVEMPDGAILAGTDGDGIAVIRNRKVEKMLTRDQGLSSEVILRMVPDQKGGVSVVTGNGLCWMDGETYAIRALDAFPYYNNYDVWMKDEDTLFVMSSAGIYVVKRDELLSGEKELNYDLLDSRRGLNSSLTANSWNYSDEEGNLFLPCDSGVFIINTNQYTAASSSYRMSLSSVRLDDQNVKIDHGAPISVGRSVARIEMRPEIINYTIQDPYVGYFLEGFDNHWTVLPQSSLSSIVYTNLPTGSYVFHLAVLDSNQQTILSERTYDLVKEKEIYDYSWFTIYVIAVLVAAVAWFTFFIVRTQVQRTLDIQKRELALARQQVQMGEETIVAVAKTVDAKDARTSRHAYRVSEYSVMIAREMGFSEEECANLRKAALMHDIGKIGIPDAILNKPGRLTNEEYAIMKSHTSKGAEILKDFTLIDHVVEGAQYHHERYDGKGYPAGLKGEEIPLYARIIGVADAFDAMTANRVYRRQMDFDYVINEMRSGRGTQFDPHIDDIFLRLIEEGKIDIQKMYAPQAGDEDHGKGEQA